MPSELEGLPERLERLEQMQKELIDAALTRGSRFEIMHQDLRRMATTLQRMGLVQQRSKAAAMKQEDLLAEIAEKLSLLLEAENKGPPHSGR